METDQKCAFCRQPVTRVKALKKLMKKNVSGAFMMMGGFYKSGEKGLFQSDTKALELFIRAAELGCANAFAVIAKYYFEGRVVEQDESKALEFWEVAAKKDSVGAHEDLALVHKRNGNVGLFIKHLKLLANAGDQLSMDTLMKCYREVELLTKEELAETLRAFQAAKNEMWSEGRDHYNAVCKELGGE